MRLFPFSTAPVPSSAFPCVRDIMDLFDRADRLLLATSQAFDFQADSLPDNFRYVGPLLDVPRLVQVFASKVVASAMVRTVGASSRTRGLQHGARKASAICFQRVLDAIGTIDVEALATTGPNLDVADLRAPKNVHVLRGAPHDLVMKDVSLVVSQGGHGTVTRSLANALPQLILPMARDQAANAARVEAKGAGLRLPPMAVRSGNGRGDEPAAHGAAI